MPLYIDAEPVPELNKYRLKTPVIIDGIYIPSNTLWDGASVPSILWPIIGSPFHPDLMAPSLCHDYRYEREIGSRKFTDKLFKKHLIANGVSKNRSKIMYLGVRIGGRSHWGRR